MGIDNNPRLLLAAAQEEAGRLREALQPFARYAEELQWLTRESEPDDVILRWPHYGSLRVLIRRKDFDAARAALSGTQ